MASYPPPKQYPPLLPIFPPPHSALPAVLPSIPQRSDFSPRFTVSTHLVPGAHLRCTPPVATPPPPPDKEHKEARAQWVREETVRPRGRYERVLWSAVNRYLPVRKSDSPPTGNGLTLFLAHANGFPKETWEPMLLDLLDTPGGALIDEVWAWEATHHGASFIINAAAGTPLASCDWGDDTRDVLNFLMHFLPSEIGTELPLHLERMPPEERALRRLRGFEERTLLAVGHSFGGCCCNWAALTHPRLFSALMLLDPVIIRAISDPKTHPGPRNPLLDGAVARRDSWSSREAAHAAFAANPFFAAWDPRVLAAYVAHGLVPSAPPATGVQLAMSRMQEALVFAGSDTSAVVWGLLPTLEERVELRFVVPGREGAPELGKPGSTAERVWRRPENASNVRMPSAGHLIVQEAPRDLAHEISQFVEKKYGPVKAHL